MRAMNSKCPNGSINVWEKSYHTNLESKVARFIRFQTRDMARFSQANLSEYIKSNTRVIIDALYPVEKDWFRLRNMTGMVLTKKGKEEIHETVSGFYPERIEQLKSSFNYFEELKQTYQFLIDHQNSSGAEGDTYFLVTDFQNLIETVVRGDLAVLLSIEGAHAFANYAPSGEYQEETNILERIRELKTWTHLPVYTTLAHHYWNGLSGHARTFKHPINLVLNQNAGIDTGITALGWKVIEELLSLDNGKRILIDTKHMSVKARLEYYDFVKRFNKVNGHRKIPIICSHTGANGQEYITQSLSEADTAGKSTGSYFNNWSINLSAEEAVLIHESGGLIGIMIDKGMLGSSETIERISSITQRHKRKEAYVKLIWDNIFFFIESIDKVSAWDVIVFGSDYDGLISHVEFYYDASTIQMLSEDMLSFLIEHNYREDLWFDFLPHQIIEKVFQTNPLNFLEKHWND